VPPTAFESRSGGVFQCKLDCGQVPKSFGLRQVEYSISPGDTGKYYANKSRSAAPRYEVGDKVWLDTKNIKTERPTKKLDDKFKGPFTVTGVGTHTVTLDLPDTWKITKTFHTSLVRLRRGEPYPGQEEVNDRDRWQEDLHMPLSFLSSTFLHDSK
jgi:hypothetical protein